MVVVKCLKFFGALGLSFKSFEASAGTATGDATAALQKFELTSDLRETSSLVSGHSSPTDAAKISLEKKKTREPVPRHFLGKKKRAAEFRIFRDFRKVSRRTNRVERVLQQLPPSLSNQIIRSICFAKYLRANPGQFKLISNSLIYLRDELAPYSSITWCKIVVACRACFRPRSSLAGVERIYLALQPSPLSTT